MVRHAKPDRPSLRILQHLRNLPGRRQDQRVRARRQVLDRSIRPVVDPGVQADFREVGADEREIVVFVGFPDPSDSIDRFLVANVAPKRVARIGRIRHKAAAADDLHDGRDLTRLGVRRVNFDESGHARIVERCGIIRDHFIRENLNERTV